MASQEILREERSLGDLFSELAEETSTLVRQEVALAQTELTEKATRVGKNVGFLVVGGAIGYAALLAVLAAVVIGLAVFIPAWLAALIVGIGVGAAAYLIISPALEALKKTDLTPRETVRSLKEDAQWLKKQMN
jgi:hypothetical protein